LEVFGAQAGYEVHGGCEAGVGSLPADGAELGVVGAGEGADDASVEGHFDGVVAEVEVP
jgi:hypothetical protein